MRKRVLCGDKQQPGTEDFGRDRGRGRVSRKGQNGSRDDGRFSDGGGRLNRGISGNQYSGGSGGWNDGRGWNSAGGGGSSSGGSGPSGGSFHGGGAGLNGGGSGSIGGRGGSSGGGSNGDGRSDFGVEAAGLATGLMALVFLLRSNGEERKTQQVLIKMDLGQVEHMGQVQPTRMVHGQI